MGHVVKVDGKNKTFYADKKGEGTPNVNEAHVFYILGEATRVRDEIQAIAGNRAHVYLVTLP